MVFGDSQRPTALSVGELALLLTAHTGGLRHHTYHGIALARTVLVCYAVKPDRLCQTGSPQAQLPAAPYLRAAVAVQTVRSSCNRRQGTVRSLFAGPYLDASVCWFRSDEALPLGIH